MTKVYVVRVVGTGEKIGPGATWDYTKEDFAYISEVVETNNAQQVEQWMITIEELEG